MQHREKQTGKDHTIRDCDIEKKTDWFSERNKQTINPPTAKNTYRYKLLTTQTALGRSHLVNGQSSGPLMSNSRPIRKVHCPREWRSWLSLQFAVSRAMDWKKIGCSAWNWSSGSWSSSWSTLHSISISDRRCASPSYNIIDNWIAEQLTEWPN